PRVRRGEDRAARRCRQAERLGGAHGDQRRAERDCKREPGSPHRPTVPPLGTGRYPPAGAGSGGRSVTGGYFARISSIKPAIRSASAASSISSTFSAFDSPEWERLKEPTKTVSSATVTFACMN